jgi:TolA-binding protein
MGEIELFCTFIKNQNVMRKVVQLLVVMISATLFATAQEGTSTKYRVSGEKLKTTYTRTLTPVSGGTMVVKKPPVAGNTAKKKYAPVEHSARGATSNSSETPAWKRAQEENRRRFGLLEQGQSDMQSDITDLQRSQQRVEVRLDRVETKIDLLSDKLSNAQLLLRSTEHSSEEKNTSEEKTSFDLSRQERNQRRVRTVVEIVAVAALIGLVGHYIGKDIKSSRNNQQPYQPPTNPTPTPTPNTNGNPAGVPTIW